MDDTTAELNAASVSDDTRATHRELLEDLVRIAKGKGLTADQQVAAFLLGSIAVMNNDILPRAPHRRGKLINTMTKEYRRLLQTYCIN